MAGTQSGKHRRGEEEKLAKRKRKKHEKMLPGDM